MASLPQLSPSSGAPAFHSSSPTKKHKLNYPNLKFVKTNAAPNFKQAPSGNYQSRNLEPVGLYFSTNTEDTLPATVVTLGDLPSHSSIYPSTLASSTKVTRSPKKSIRKH